MEYTNSLGVIPVSINGTGDVTVFVLPQESRRNIIPPPPSDATEDKGDGEMASKFKTITEEYQWKDESERECNGKILDQENGFDEDNSRKRIPINNLDDPGVESEVIMQSSGRLAGHDQDKNDVKRKKHYVDIQQIVDMVPRTMEEVFSYKIDWEVSDKHELHEVMRPWISERVLKYMEEESVQDFMVDWIGTSIEKHESPSEILDTLKPMLKGEADMFFLSLWRMFIFEIKKVEKAEQISNVNPKEKRSKVERPINLRSGDRLTVQGQYGNDMESTNCTLDVNKDTTRDSGSLNLRKAFDVKKFWQDEPFPDFIPKTKEELLAYNINWSVSDKHELHKKMGPWISLKVMDAREKDVPSRVDKIVNTIKNHVCATDMVKELYHLFDEETDMFVANMMAMLIFQIKKVQAELDNVEKSEVDTKRILQYLDMETSSCVRYVKKVKLMDCESIQAYRDLVMSFDSGQRYKLRQITNTRPKTKEAVFSYEINWDVYWKYGLHEDTGEWLVKVIPEFINGKEEAIQVYNLIMSSIRGHVSASRMVELLQPSLGKKSEMFVYGLWSWIILGHNLERENAFARGT